MSARYLLLALGSGCLVCATPALSTCGEHGTDKAGLVQTHIHREKVQQSVRVRYAVFGFHDNAQYIETTLLPLLASSICQVERFLAPAVEVKYTILINTLVEDSVKAVLMEDFLNVMPRITFWNLDEDPNDKIRMAAYDSFQLDDVNLASVRRMLADVHLPATEDRLFLGTDVSFLKRPDELLSKIQQEKGQVVYMPCEKPYLVAAYDGPQCKGLLGDFFFVPAGMQIPEEDAHQALKLYAGAPHYPPRLTPPCPHCDITSNGLHAMDQFAWQIVLGKASNGQCLSLDSTRYQHEYIGDNLASVNGNSEAVHDKRIRCRRK